MALSVVEQYTVGGETFGTSPSIPAFICLRSDLPLSKQISELTEGPARKMAIAIAQVRGISDPRINGFGGAAFPVDQEGRPLTDPIKQKIHEYHADIPVCGRLV